MIHSASPGWAALVIVPYFSLTSSRLPACMLLPTHFHTNSCLPKSSLSSFPHQKKMFVPALNNDFMCDFFSSVDYVSKMRKTSYIILKDGQYSKNVTLRYMKTALWWTICFVMTCFIFSFCRNKRCKKLTAGNSRGLAAESLTMVVAVNQTMAWFIHNWPQGRGLPKNILFTPFYVLWQKIKRFNLNFVSLCCWDRCIRSY